MNDSPLYTESEMAVIGEFLRDCVDRAAAETCLARPINLEEQIRPELERLKKKRKAGHKEIMPEDVCELEEAVKSPFAPIFHVDRDQVLLQHQYSAVEGNQNESIGILFLKNFAKRLCATALKPIKSKTILISSSGLVWLFNLLSIPPVCAPAVVWLATKLRDIGVPAFCDTLNAFLDRQESSFAQR